MTKEKVKPKQFVTDSNIPVKPVYSKSKNSTESPGKYPFTRGIHSGMYRVNGYLPGLSVEFFDLL
jgi:methylmalonyl-CoA mutase N-terminal domain/subunit